MRSSYRKEIKKIKACIGTDEVYTPKLWYFQQLSFLNDQDIPKSDSNNDNDNDSDGDVSIKTEVIDTTDNILNDEIFEKDGYIIQSVRQHQTIRPPKKRKLDAGAISKDILLTVKKHFKHLAREDDRFDLCGKNVAMKLRSVSKPQMLIAEKLINEILFEAELGNLTLSHEITTQRQPNIPDLNFKQQTYYDEKFINSSSTETENLTGSSTQMQVDHTNHNSIMQVFQNHGYIKAEKSENATDSSLINLNCNDL